MRSEHGLRRPRFLVRALAFTSILGAAASGCGSRSSWSASDASDSGLNVLDANSDRLDESDTPAPWSPDLAADLTWDCGSSDFDSWSLDVGPRTLDPPDVAVAADLPQEVDAPPNMPDAAFAADISVQPPNAVLGTVRTYASAPAIGTVVGFPSQERVLFLTGNLLTLAKINNDQLEVLDRAQWGSSVSSFQISSMIWVFRSTAFIVPLSPTRVAVVGADWSIDLYDIGQDRLQPSYRFGFGAGNRSLTAITTSQGKNLWTCMNTNIRRYQIDDVQQYIRQDPAFRLPTDHLCYGLSVSSDGRTLLAATSSGLDVVDISIGDGTGTLQQTVLSGDFLVDVVSNGQEIGVYRIDDATNGVGTVRTLAAADYTPIATFASSGNIIEAGFTMMAGGLLLDQWDNTNCRVVQAAFFSSGGSTTTPTTSYVPMTACKANYGSPPAVLATSGQLVDLPPAHQVVRVDPTTMQVTPLLGREQGSLARVLPAGQNLVEVHGPTSMHLVDISQPTSPAIIVGGPIVPMNADWLRFEISNTGYAFALSVPISNFQPAGPRTSLYWQNQGGLPTLAGSIANDDTVAQWAAAGPYLISVSPDSVSNFHVRRLRVDSLTRLENQTPSPDFDQILASAAPTTLDQRQGVVIAADAVNADFVVAENRRNTTTTATVVSWYTQQNGGYQSAFSRSPDNGTVVDVGVANGHAVVIFDDHVLLVDKAGSTLATYTHTSGDLARLLSIEDGYIYLAGTIQNTQHQVVNGAFALRATDLTLAGQYTLSEPVLSTAVVGNYRVFGMASALAVASPLCNSP